MFHTISLTFPDDEGGNIKPVCQPKKSSQSDLYMRLGLLLGDNARRRSRSANRGSHSHDSISSLASIEANTLASSNTSPVSTLTGKQSCCSIFSEGRTQGADLLTSF